MTMDDAVEYYELARLLECLDELEIRSYVRGWNSEYFPPEKRERLPDEKRIWLETTAGVVYAIDDAIESLRAKLALPQKDSA